MKIFGHPMSTCTRKVIMTLAETNTPYELVLVDLMKGEHKQPPHLARQPFGQVPAIEDGDFKMYESRAICRYINDKARGSLIPSDPQTRARMEQWISIETSDFTPPVMKFVFHDIFKVQQTPETLKTAGEGTSKALGIIDQHLAKQPFMAGETFTLADICYMPYFEYALATVGKDLFPQHKNAMAWWSKVSAKPTWQKTIGKA